ncbi:unnamed protein product [Rotaria sordida]|uniref:Cysteine synthase 1 n=1 Tax=Rotaria sordida TaxID=392033 RepID=A0A819EMR0_9BILA|nr:unnamed protein product [Rotaria sordida]CAF3853557.1 unnamed protein product [Rotaria sordida]
MLSKTMRYYGQRSLSTDVSAYARILEGFRGSIGNTPLIRLPKLSQETGCNILVKAEYLNPGGSIKDRAALFLIKDALDKNLIKSGATIVEGTAGNTGIGLAHICNALGLKCVIFMPDNQSKEKIDILRVLGAEVTTVPVVPITDPNNYNHHAKRYAEQHENSVWTNQFDNRANRDGHYSTTGPEVWTQTNGKVNAFVMSTGTGGTLAGTCMYLKEKNSKIRTVLADPPGSVLYHYIKSGKLERTDGSSITEGIGQGRLTQNLKDAPIDESLFIKDQDSVNMVFKLLCEEGFFIGASSGLNVAAAVEISKSMPKGSTIVTTICDNGQKYFNRLFNKNELSKRVGLFLGIFITTLLPKLFIKSTWEKNKQQINLANIKNEYNFIEYSQWPPFLTDPTFDLTLWRKHCWINQISLPTQDTKLYYKKNYTAYNVCKDVISLINSIYNMKTNIAKVEYPETFAQKIRKIFNYDNTLYAKALEQELYFVMNKYTFEHTVYNPLRGRRPIQSPEVPIEQYLNETIEKTSQNCDLCNYQNMTAIDSLGRMENRYAYSAANAFKFDQWHSMFMPKQHDITKLTFEELKDIFTLAWKWFQTVHKQSSSHRFPTLLWDSLPHGGASQVHPHIHATLHSDHYYGQFESIRFASERYYREYINISKHGKKNFFRTIQDIHMAFNLTISFNGITVLIPITSRKEYDIIVLAENFDERFIKVIYQIIQGYFNKLKQFSFSSCLYLPPLSPNQDDSGLTPVYYRIIPRGQISSLLSEISSLDLLSIHNVNKLPADLFAEIITWFQEI